MKIDYPVKHIEGNLVYGVNNTVWAYFKVTGFNYDFLDNNEKIVPFEQQLSFLANLGLDIHYLSLPTPTDVEQILNRTMEEMSFKTYALKQNGMKFMEQVKKVLKEHTSNAESSEYQDYIGIQLDPSKNKYISANAGLVLFNSIKKFFNGLNSPVYQAVGLYPMDILESDIQIHKNQTRSIKQQIQNAFNCNIVEVTKLEVVNILEKLLSASSLQNDIKMRKEFNCSEEVIGVDKDNRKYKAYRTNKKDFLPIYNTNIEEVSAKELLFSKITEDNEITDVYVQYLIVSDMASVRYHPNSEWLYYIKTKIPFPVTISIRADNMPNDLVTKRLGNAQLEIKDQQQEANKSGENADLNVDISSKAVVQMNSYFTSSGLPAFACNFILKITGKTREELRSRVNYLRDKLNPYNIKFEIPYGEQINLMLETIPTSNKKMEDYRMEVSPEVLAGMMFGATTNIGDNRGFYIGNTINEDKPVFIQPDLAAKAFKGLNNLVDSISVLVAGATGKGKSFFMNLFIYLSVLTGSQGIIVDPKGDRKGWVNGLPFIPKEMINVWTLGANQIDAGILDPFRTSVDLAEGKAMTMDILSYLANLEIEDDGYSILNKAVEQAALHEDACLGVVLSVLNDMYVNGKDKMSVKRYQALESLLSTLEALRNNPLSILLFGEVGQTHRTLSHEIPIQVLMIQNLTLPNGKTERKLPAHMISEAILISITAWTKKYMFHQKREIHKFILQDEASAIERSPFGRELMDFIVRMGRYYNTTLLKGSQNATDHGEDVANIGMKFSFGLRKYDEAQLMLKYLNLPVTSSNARRLTNLQKGQALFQDIYGRSAVIQINPIFEELYTAFDTSTSTKEEREREFAHTGV